MFPTGIWFRHMSNGNQMRVPAFYDELVSGALTNRRPTQKSEASLLECRNVAHAPQWLRLSLYGAAFRLKPERVETIFAYGTSSIERYWRIQRRWG